MVPRPARIPGMRRGWNGQQPHRPRWRTFMRSRPSRKTPMTMRSSRRRLLSEAVLDHLQFTDAHQQREAARIGMWIFLATEVMFFAALFTAYSIFLHLN